MFHSIRPSWSFTVLPIALAASMTFAAPPLAASSAAVPTALPAWADTGTPAVTLAGMADLGRADGATPLPLMVTLKLRNRAALDTFMGHLTTPGDPLYQHYVSAYEFASLYGPRMSDAEAVIRYLSSQGFTRIELSDNRTQIRMLGTVAQAEAAFNTQIHKFQYKGKEVLANVAAAQVPATLAAPVLNVVGLNDIQTFFLPANRMKKVDAVASPAAVGPPAAKVLGFTPQDFQKGYNVGTTPDGSKVNVAIFTEGNLDPVVGTHPGITNPKDPNYDATADLRLYEKAYSLPPVPVTIINTGYAHTDTTGQGEFDLDTQVSSGIANNVKSLVLYNAASLANLEILVAFNRIASDNIAPVANASIGGCESFFFAFGLAGSLDQITEQMAAQGQTLFASTGDNGAYCKGATNGAPGGVPEVELPASNTWVMAVGGTDLTVNSDGSYDLEIAWEAGGGGTSTFSTAGSWQGGKTLASTAGSPYKAVPDIAMDAGLETGAYVYSAGALVTTGGTSLASPLAAGVWSRMQSARVTASNPYSPLGFAAPDLYALAVAPTSVTPAKGFNDVLAGNNGLYSAGPNWDFTTGLGSLDMTALNAALKTVAVPSDVVAPVLGGNVCTVPGYKVATGAKGANNDAASGNTGHNTLAVYYSEAYAPNQPESLTISLDTDAIDTLTAYYEVDYTTEDGIDADAAGYYVGYDPLQAAGAQYYYGHFSGTSHVQDGTLTGTTATVTNPDGTTVARTTWVVPRTGVATLGKATRIARMFGEVVENGFGAHVYPYDSTAPGAIVPDAAFYCDPAPTAALVTTPAPAKGQTTTTVAEGDPVTFDASGSTAAGATSGEKLTTYVFDFGDGTKLSGSNAKVTHSYSAGGTYPATVKVTDSSGKTSTNNALAVVTVTAPAINPFSFTERTNVPGNTFVTSEPVTIGGIAGQSYRISVANGDAPAMQCSINGGAFTSSPGVISVGDTLVVRQLSAAKDTTSQTSSVTVGNLTVGFKVTTGKTPDTVPDAFDFGETDNVTGGVVQTSKTLVPASYDYAPVVAGPGMSYSIAGGAFTSANGTISKGQSITARLTSAKGSLIYTKGYISIGGVKGTFTTRNKK